MPSAPLPLSPDLQRGPVRPVVSAEAVARLPRWPLWLMCALYVVPGFIGRDPWSADGLAFGMMVRLADGHGNWLAPSLYGQPVPGGWLAYWLGAIAIRGLGPWLGQIMASRVPFAILLAGSLVMLWQAAYRFALRDAMQPVQPAFAPPISRRAYARVMADGALLSLVACLGLLTLGHEAGPYLILLSGSTAVLLALALAPTSPALAACVLGAALVVLAFGGAPWLALVDALAAGGLLLHPAVRQARAHLVVAVLLGVLAALAALPAANGLGAPSVDALARIPGTLAWFLWPAWPLALWALWRWRESRREWHVLVPIAMAAPPLLATMFAHHGATPELLALPALAQLAALALPVMQRGSLAALDWFALMFFSLFALVVWVLWIALLTGWPSQPAANIARLAPGYAAHLVVLPTLVALLATIAWTAIVAWRAGRHRHPLWKGMVLSAGGVTLVWTLVGTLWLPVLDYASTYRNLGVAMAAALRADHAPESASVQGIGLTLAQQALLGYWSGAEFGATRVGSAAYALMLWHGRHPAASPPGAARIWEGNRPGEHDEHFTLYRLASAPSAAH